MVIDVGHSQRLNGCGPNAQQHLGPDKQQVHHVGVGPVATQVTWVSGPWPGAVGTHVPALASGPEVPTLVLVLVRQELGERREQCPQCHDNAATADEAGAVGPRPEVADEEDKGQVANLKAAGDHAYVRALQVKAPLQGGQYTHLKQPETEIKEGGQKDRERDGQHQRETGGEKSDMQRDGKGEKWQERGWEDKERVREKWKRERPVVEGRVDRWSEEERGRVEKI